MSEYDAIFDSVAKGGKPPANEYDAIFQNVASGLQPSQAAQKIATPAQSPTLFDRVRDISKGYDELKTNLGAGLIRGAGDIGATLIRPFESGAENAQRRQSMDAGLRELTGANPDSFGYGAGKLGGELLGTAGVGNLLAVPFRAAPLVANALQSGGMVAGAKGFMPNLALRAGSGAAVGGASAGLVNPEDAKMGAMIGGGFAPLAKGVGAVSEAAGNMLTGGARLPVSQQTIDAAKRGVESGFVIPPATVNPTFSNRLLESISGKQATQQLASYQNAENTNKLARQSLGLSGDAKLDISTLDKIRKDAGQAYAAVASLPVKQAENASTLMNKVGAPEIKPAQIVEDLKQSRNDAQTWFKAYNASANPEHLAKARASDALSKQLDNQITDYANALGKPKLIEDLNDARKLIAKTYTVERALNQSTGNVDSRVLGRLYEKGKPLSDGLEKAGEFASAFPTISKRPEVIGSPDTHNL
ncbi:MAG: hypothetical protein RL535_1401, partial [Pseudomonadota bacterium]